MGGEASRGACPDPIAWLPEHPRNTAYVRGQAPWRNEEHSVSPEATSTHFGGDNRCLGGRVGRGSPRGDGCLGLIRHSTDPGHAPSAIDAPHSQHFLRNVAEIEGM